MAAKRERSEEGEEGVEEEEERRCRSRRRKVRKKAQKEHRKEMEGATGAARCLTSAGHRSAGAHLFTPAGTCCGHCQCARWGEPGGLCLVEQVTASTVASTQSTKHWCEVVSGCWWIDQRGVWAVSGATLKPLCKEGRGRSLTIGECDCLNSGHWHY